jgi:ribose 5-phosphate isomerase A
MLSANDIKREVGIKASKLVKPGMVVGIGTGTTAYYLIVSLAQLVREGMDIRCVPTSRATERLALDSKLRLTGLNDVEHIDITIDGADEIDPQLQLIKGGGGALLQEKMVAAASKQMIVIADHTKLVKQLGTFPLPVEVIPFGWKQVQRYIQQLYPIQATLRMKDNSVFRTDHGHHILDCHFGHITDARSLHATLNTIPGVVENGLFLGMATGTMIGYPDGRVEVSHR